MSIDDRYYEFEVEPNDPFETAEDYERFDSMWDEPEFTIDYIPTPTPSQEENLRRRGHLGNKDGVPEAD